MLSIAFPNRTNVHDKQYERELASFHRREQRGEDRWDVNGSQIAGRDAAALLIHHRRLGSCSTRDSLRHSPADSSDLFAQARQNARV